ncbi:MAG: type IV toxin-antitoxin system AbiEi family antitoxin [Actinomycetota bacterium]|nr:type IV toxin-antitoxin system AbiEi family antitoxin [Actinomycetota bacterium]
MESIFIGSEAVSAGLLDANDLRRRYRRLLPDVYGPPVAEPTLQDRITASWLWSGRKGVIAGAAASALLGAKWVNADTPIELIHANNRAASGVVTRRDTLLDGETTVRGGIPLTTAERTAFDLARRGSVGHAVARLDALAHATPFTSADVLELVSRHSRVRGLRRVDRVLDLVDSGAESPRETWLRLLLIRAGYPRPQTQIPLLGPDGFPIYRLDMGWEDEFIAVEYDGDDHREKGRWRNDIVRSEYVAHVGWTLIRVVAGEREADVLRRVERAWTST